MSLSNVIQRDFHWSDTVPDPLHLQNKKRIIQNWLNFKLPNRDWQESNLITEEVLSIPDNWTGQFDFKYQQLNSPLQVFAGDSTDPLNTALFGARWASNPEYWFNMKFIGVTASQPIIYPVIQTIRWNDIYTKTDLGLRAYKHKIEKILKLKAPGHPTSFRFALRLPPGFSYLIINDSLRILDDQGKVIFRSFPVHGWDSATTALSADGSNSIRVSLVEAPPITVGGKTFPTFRLIPNQDDLSSAIYPVFIDPTVTITGIAAIEDTMLNDTSTGNKNNNYGNTTVIQVFKWASGHIKPIWRILSGIPAGTITGFRHFWYTNFLVTPNFPVDYHRITNANTWVEGTVSGAIQVGSPCWNWTKYNTQAWAGSLGCNTSGTDFEASVGTNYTITAWPQWETVSLPTVWASDFRDGVWINGFLFKPAAGYVTGNNCQICSTEYAGTNPYFEVDYTTANTMKISVFKNIIRKKIL